MNDQLTQTLPKGSGGPFAVIISLANLSQVRCCNDCGGVGIIKAAEDAGTDLLVIGSRECRGLERLFIGSSGQKALPHTKILTLAVR